MQQASRRRGFQDCPTGTSRTSQERCKGKKLHFSVGSAASAVKSPSPTLTGTFPEAASKPSALDYLQELTSGDGWWRALNLHAEGPGFGPIAQVHLL